MNRASSGAARGVRLVAGRSPLPLTWRLSIWYAAMFLTIGLFTPWWPVWLESRGLGPGEIGIVLALTTWTRIAASPLAAGLADRLGRRRPVMLALSCGALVAFAFYAAADGFMQLALAAVGLGLCFPPLMPVGENLTMLAARVRRFDYGRVRLWGSLAFIAAAWGGGALIGGDPRAVPWLTLGAAALAVCACANLPDVRAAPAGGAFSGLGALLRRPSFLLFLAVAGLVQGSHAAYYAFATLHWRAAGLDPFVIGALWAEGVFAEVALFAVSGRLARRVGVAPMFALAALAGAVRWTVIGATASLAALAAVQALHAGTFAATHLAAMRFIQSRVPPAASATAQGLYSAVATGTVMALATMAAGRLYAVSPAGAFHAMAAMCVLAGIGAPWLARRPDPDGPERKAREHRRNGGDQRPFPHNGRRMAGG